MKRIATHPSLLSLLTFVIAATPLCAASTGWRLTGTLEARSYGYQDIQGTDHLWLMPSTDLSAYRLGTPLAFHFSGGYVGDNADEFASSGRGRLTSLYLQYGDLLNSASSSSVRSSDLTEHQNSASARIGRFFLYRGVAPGVIDGFEASRTFNPHWSGAVFAGTLGPSTFGFALTDPNRSPVFGGQVAYSTTSIPYTELNRFTLSYTRQTRDDLLLRNRVGLQTWHRINRQLSWSNRLEARLSGDVLRRLVSRVRYTTTQWSAMLEGGIFTPEIADDSWFNGFGGMSYERIRIELYRWWQTNRWGAGLDASALMTESISGVRLGPAFFTPYGQLGYRFTHGDRAQSSGPWVNLHSDLGAGVSIYALASRTSYEWEAMDIENGELTAMSAGISFTPSITPNTTLTAEYQTYSTPQMEKDRRAQAALVWRFDTRRSTREAR